MPQAPAAFQQTVWNPILDPTTINRGASSSIVALLLDFKNGIYQQTRTRTNLLLWSQQFGNAVWDTFNATVSDNSTTAPDGTNTASTINVTQTTDRNRQMFTVVPGTVYTYSVWLKRGTCTDHKVSVYDITHAAEILAPTSIYSQLSSTTWTRYTYTFTAPTGCTSAYVYTSRDNGAIGTYFVWGAQLEAAPAASDYIPTTSAAVSVTESITDQTPLVTNKSTNYNANPTATTNMTKAGDAAAVLSVVSDTAALATANLNGYCSGNVYKLDNTSGVADAFVTVGGFTADLNTHTVSAYVRGTGTVKLGGYVSDTSLANFTLAAGYVRQSRTFVSGATNDQFRIQVTAGSVVYFILNQLEEAYQASANPIVISGGPATVGAVTDLYGYTYSRSGAKEEVGTTYGPELVTNGTFDTSMAGWTDNSSNTSSASVSGEARATSTGTGACTTSQPLSTVAGKTYTVNGSYRAGIGTGGISINALATQFGSTIASASSTSTTTTPASFTFTATGATTWIGFRLSNAAVSDTGYFDNISVKEVIPASSFAANVPAIIPGTGYFARPGYTNLFTWSQDFTNAAWTKSTNVVTVTGGSIAPDGSSTACLWTRTGTGSTNIGQGYTKAASAIQYNFSVFAKQSTGRYLAMRAQGSYPALADVVVDLQTGTVFSTGQNTFSAPTANVKAVGNGFYRIDFTTTTDTASRVTLYLSFNSNGVVIDGTDSSATSSGYLWQAQLVQASDPGPIIVTTSASAAVGADVLTLPPTFSADQDMVIAIKLNMPSIASIISATTSVLEFTDGTAANRLVLYAFNLTQWGIYTNSGNTIQRNTPITNATITTGTQILAIRRRSGKYTGAYVSNTGTVTVETEGGATTFPVGMNKLAVATNFSSTNQLNGAVQSVIIRPGTFSDTDVTNILTAL